MTAYPSVEDGEIRGHPAGQCTVRCALAPTEYISSIVIPKPYERCGPTHVELNFSGTDKYTLQEYVDINDSGEPCTESKPQYYRKGSPSHKGSFVQRGPAKQLHSLLQAQSGDYLRNGLLWLAIVISLECPYKRPEELSSPH